MATADVVVGIDVAKGQLEVMVLGVAWTSTQFGNDVEGHSALAAALAPLGVQLVVLEASGGYEAAAACALQAAGLSVAVIRRVCLANALEWLGLEGEALAPPTRAPGSPARG